MNISEILAEGYSNLHYHVSIPHINTVASLRVLIACLALDCTIQSHLEINCNASFVISNCLDSKVCFSGGISSV